MISCFMNVLTKLGGGVAWHCSLGSNVLGRAWSQWCEWGIVGVGYSLWILYLVCSDWECSFSEDGLPFLRHCILSYRLGKVSFFLLFFSY